jgi:hypothetical protein
VTRSYTKGYDYPCSDNGIFRTDKHEVYLYEYVKGLFVAFSEKSVLPPPLVKGVGETSQKPSIATPLVKGGHLALARLGDFSQRPNQDDWDTV